MPYIFFPSVSQQTIWGTIAGNIHLQSDLLDLVRNLSLSGVILTFDFSKYGEISAGEYFFPHKIYLRNGQKAEIIAYEVGLSVGTAVVSISRNGSLIEQLVAIQANSSFASISLPEPIELAQNDKLSVSISQPENAQNLLFRLIIQVGKKDEN